MIIPVRCFTCGKVIGNKYDTYLELIDQQQQRVEEARQRGDLDREEMYAAHDDHQTCSWKAQHPNPTPSPPFHF